jgi:predicted nucleotidyltransferase component of viral defense system
MNNELNDILLKRLKDYSITTEEDELRAAHEITQELVLYSLAKTSFFEHGLFQGGTSLRILLE